MESAQFKTVATIENGCKSISFMDTGSKFGMLVAETESHSQHIQNSQYLIIANYIAHHLQGLTKKKSTTPFFLTMRRSFTPLRNARPLNIYLREIVVNIFTK